MNVLVLLSDYTARSVTNNILLGVNAVLIFTRPHIIL